MSALKTTFAKIKSHRPCVSGWEKLLANCNPERDMQKEISLMQIYESNGIANAIWALRCWDFRDYCLFAAEALERALPLYEDRFSAEPACREVIDAIRMYSNGQLDLQSAEKIFASTNQVLHEMENNPYDFPSDAPAWSVLQAALTAINTIAFLLTDTDVSDDYRRELSGEGLRSAINYIASIFDLPGCEWATTAHEILVDLFIQYFWEGDGAYSPSLP